MLLHLSSFYDIKDRNSSKQFLKQFISKYVAATLVGSLRLHRVVSGRKASKIQSTVCNS